MKIERPPQPLPLASTGRSRAAEPVGKAEGVGGATKVTLSGDARFVERVRDEMRSGPPVRADKVDEVRQALKDGSYERGVDLDQLVDRMLEDL
ncbi:MAG: flagellar biosynthesis anti-sigma factor FlgM [Myxococcales bacterium]|nr:flagellar biosynthesis anti-sigma factor FlgM [Myxococcales bacterium]